MLRQSAQCVIETWPEKMYREFDPAQPFKGIQYIVNPEIIAEILLNPNGHFEQSKITRRILKPIWRSGITAAAGAEWRWQRHAASPAFTPKSVETIIPAALNAAQKVISSWENRDDALDVTDALGDAAQRILLESMIGDLLPESETQTLLDKGNALMSEMKRINYADLLQFPNWTRRFLGPTFEKSSAVLHREIEAHLSDQTNRPEINAPLLKTLVSSKDPETGKLMSQERLRDNIVGFLAAGRETTALTVSWAMLLLALDEKAQTRLRAEVREVGALEPHSIPKLEFTRSVLLETMRLYPPAPQIARDCRVDTKIAGVRFKKGDLVNIPIYAVHRHHKLWAQPDSFVADRFVKPPLPPKKLRWQYLPFGGGAHVCLGQAFAMTEASVLLAKIVEKFHISAPDPDAVEFEVGASLRPKGGLHLRLCALT